ncbi:MAG: ABC transporter permease subunit [Desulfobacter sp.]|nr:MAG: ABC transporter permease subunit [Desulfobacter sp.]
MAGRIKPAPAVFAGAAVLSAGVTLAVMGFMLSLSLPVIRSGQLWSILSGPWAPGSGQFGITAMIVGTVYIAGLSLIFSIPLSLGCAFFTDIVKPKGARKVLAVLVRIMTAVPTVIYGFVGVFLLVPQMRAIAGRGSGMTILTAALMLALLIAPTMILFFSQSFARVPKADVLGAEALGATPFQKLIYVILPGAWPGMLTGIILAFGRAMGDTLIALMLSGNSVMVPAMPLDPGRSLTAHIALILAADFDSLEFRTIFVCGSLLYLATGTAVLAARVWERRQP